MTSTLEVAVYTMMMVIMRTMMMDREVVDIVMAVGINIHATMEMVAVLRYPVVPSE